MEDEIKTQSRQDCAQAAKPTTATTRDSFSEAAQRVFDQYGPDLPAFFRDVQRDLAKRQGQLEATLLVPSEKFRPNPQRAIVAVVFSDYPMDAEEA